MSSSSPPQEATLTIAADTVLTPDGAVSPGWVTVTDGRVSAVGSGAAPAGVRVETVTGTLVPGFVDVHVHGGGGAWFSGGAEAVDTVVATHLAHGTTSMVASLVTEPQARLLQQVGDLVDHVRDGRLAGIHLEGPFLSQARCGAHDPALLRDPSEDLLGPLLEAGQGTISMVTLAPERPHAIEAIRRLVAAGVVAAVGHTDATAAQCAEAFDAGASVATHLFNGMRPVHDRRDGGPVVASLLDERVSLELIHDGVHVAHETVALVRRLAGDRLVLITDAMAAAGAGDGQFLIGDLPVHVEDGVALLTDGKTLAGSTLTMDAAFARLVRDHGASLAEASAAASARPAALLGLHDRGALAVGSWADLVVLDAGWSVTRVMKEGAWVA